MDEGREIPAGQYCVLQALILVLNSSLCNEPINNLTVAEIMNSNDWNEPSLPMALGKSLISIPCSQGRSPGI
jgi:hypothetical protein